MQLAQAPTTGWLMSCPLLFSLARSFRRLSDVHNCRRIGSPHRFKQRLEIGKEGWVLGHPRFASPPRRRTRSFPTEARPSRSSRPRYIVRRARPVASATALTPPCPIIRASDAAQRRRLLSSSRGAIDFQRFRSALMAEALITRRFYCHRFSSRNPQAIILTERDKNDSVNT